jgi:hypothetical protein
VQREIGASFCKIEVRREMRKRAAKLEASLHFST